MAARLSNVYAFGPFRLDAEEGLLLRDGEPVRLTPKTFDMLRVLVENRGRLVHKDELMQLVWPDSFVDEGNLSHHVFSLRKALGDERGSSTYIETIPKRGYRFVGEVLEATPRIRSLVVLPLANRSADAGQDYFADGVTEALIADLASVKTLRVISRTSAMRYKATPKPPPEIAQELKVDGIVAGSVFRAGDRVHLSLEVIHAATDAQVWSTTYERSTRDVISLPREAAWAVAQAIDAVSRSAQRPLPDRPVEPQSHEAYLKGRYFYGKATEEGFRRAVEYLRVSIDTDPDFAPAHAALADAHIALAAFGASIPLEAFTSARAAALAALRIDPKLADAHRVLALVRMCGEWNWAAAESSFRQALDTHPGSAETHWQYSVYLTARGRCGEAIEEAERARALDPLSLMINNDLGFALWCARRRDDAIAQYRHTLDLDGHFVESRRELGLIYAETGDTLAALRELEKAAALGPETETSAFLGYTLGKAGRPDEARRILAELSDRGEREYVSPTASALIQVGLGEHQAAFMSLEQACDAKCPWVIFLQSWPVFDPLRSHARFQDLRRRIGLSVDDGC